MGYDTNKITTNMKTEQRALRVAVTNLSLVVSRIAVENQEIIKKLAQFENIENDDNDDEKTNSELHACRTKEKHLENIKNKIKNVLVAAQHHTFGNFTYNHLSKNDIEVIAHQSKVLGNLFKPRDSDNAYSSEEPLKNELTSLFDDGKEANFKNLNQFTYPISRGVVWERRATYVFMLLAVTGISLTIAVVLFTPMTSLATLPAGFAFAFYSLCAYLCLCPVATHPMTANVGGMSMTTQVPGFATALPLLAAFLYAFLCRSRLAAWSIDPPREVAALELQAAVFNYLADNMLEQFSNEDLDDQQKHLIQKARLLYQEGMDSWFYETSICKIRAAIKMLENINNSSPDLDENSQGDIEDQDKKSRTRSCVDTLKSYFFNNDTAYAELQDRKVDQTMAIKN